MASSQRLEQWESRSEWVLAAVAVIFLVVYSVQVLAEPPRAVNNTLDAVMTVLYVTFVVDYVVLDLVAVDFDKDAAVFGEKTMRTEADVARAARAFAERRPPEALVLAAPGRPCPPAARKPAFGVQFAVLAWRIGLGHARHPGNVAARAALTA